MKRFGVLKKEALQALKGNWDNAVLSSLIFLVLTIIISESSSFYSFFAELNPSFIASTSLLLTLAGFSVLASVFVLAPIGGGYANATKKLVESKGADNELVDGMFKIGFGKNYLRFVLMVVLTEIIYFFLFGLFFAPSFFILSVVTRLILIGVAIFVFLVFVTIISLMLAMTPFLIVDEPQLSVVDAMIKSCRMMKGRKWKLFVLEISFIGWILLSILTLFIGLLWVIPYCQASIGAFYLNLKEEQQAA